MDTATTGVSSLFEPRSCGTLLTFTKGNGISETYVLERSNDIRVIVQFRSLPLSRVNKMGKALSVDMIQSALTSLRAEHTQFRSDLVMIEMSVNSTKTSQPGIKDTEVLAEYQTAFNGVAITTSRSVAKLIQRLPYVVRIWEDITVKALDDTSNAIIGAPKYWTSTNEHGEDIDIGIIDSGIDYLHEALGGAAFPNSKVVGGYDFVNDDSDPMDDNGHGTHVAGIAAGDGPPPTNLRGVAYKARLWAFKVIHADGYGYSSWIISGIENALDPDENPMTPTPIEVVNLSLGGLGDTDDPICQAVDNATAAGIVCVVAAGNDGPLHGMISSPACGRSSFTVGAATDHNKIADFSSRGPTYKSWLIKPDIVAPGFSILSADRGGGYITHSGTSMAAPHVSGAAALIRQLHPDWTPEEVKAVLVQTAKNIGEEVWAQGGGQLSLTNTLSRNMVITPTTLNFGVDDSPAQYWTTSRVLTIRNHESMTTSFTLSTKLPSIRGVTLIFNPAVVAIPGNSSTSVDVTLYVDNSKVPFKQVNNWETEQPNYDGKILASSTIPSLTVQIPFAFVKHRMLRFVMDETPWWFGITQPYAHDMFCSEVYTAYIPAVNDTLDMLWDPGTYDVLGTYDDLRTKIVKENVVLGDGVTYVFFRKADAKNRIILRRLDELGQPVPFSISPIAGESGWGWSESLVDSSGVGWTTNCAMDRCQPDSTLDTLDFPDISTRRRFSMIFGAIHNSNYYAFSYSTQFGISSSLTLENDPNAFKEIHYTYIPKEGDSAVFVAPWMTMQIDVNPRYVQLPPITIGAPYKIKAYVVPPPIPDTSLTYGQLVIDGLIGPGWYGRTRYSLPSMTFSSGSPKVDFFENDNINYRMKSQIHLLSTTTFPAELKVGYGAPHWNGKTSNSPSQIVVQDSVFARMFVGPLWDVPVPQDLQYRLYDRNTLISSGQLRYGFSYNNPTNGPFVFETEFSQYKIADLWGNASVRLEFDVSRIDPNTPALKSLWIMANGFVADGMIIGDVNEICIEASDETGIDTAHVYLKPLGASEWREITLSVDGNRFNGRISDSLDEGYISTRLRIVDPSGNALDYKIEPAFLFHRIFPSKPSLVSPADSTIDVPNIVSFRWNRSAGASSYHLKVADDTDFTHLLVDDPSLTTTFSKVGPLGKEKKYYWKVCATNILGSSDYSETRGFTTADTFNTVVVSESWNLISIPLQLHDPTRQHVFPNANSVAFSYDGSGYLEQNSLRLGIGYWLRLPGNDTIIIAGKSVASDTINVQSGWNLIGSISNDISTGLVVQVPDSNIISSYFGYVSGYKMTNIIEAGKGYWVKATGDGKLILSSDELTQKVSISDPIEKQLNLVTQIYFEDTAGMHQTLYLCPQSDHAMDINLFQLPPLPPIGVFDVRYASGRVLENLNDEKVQEIPLLLSTDHYPISVWIESSGEPLSISLRTSDGTLPLKFGTKVLLHKQYESTSILIEDKIEVPSIFSLMQNYPNPFNPTTTIQYDLPIASFVTLKVFNMLGQEVQTLVSEKQEARSYEVRFDGSSLPSGVYFYRLISKDYTATKKFILLK